MSSIPTENVTSIEVDHDFIDVVCGVDYYGSDSGYMRHETVIREIVDKHDRAVRVVWETKRTEIAPGIETGSESEGWRHGSQEHIKRQSIRIFRSACPVHVRFEHRSQYTSYESGGDSNSYEYWQRYEAVNPKVK
jgi:hypothetical protein